MIRWSAAKDHALFFGLAALSCALVVGWGLLANAMGW